MSVERMTAADKLEAAKQIRTERELHEKELREFESSRQGQKFIKDLEKSHMFAENHDHGLNGLKAIDMIWWVDRAYKVDRFKAICNLYTLGFMAGYKQAQKDQKKTIGK